MSQIISELRCLSEALYESQFVVRYLARRGLLITSDYQITPSAEALMRSSATTPATAVLCLFYSLGYSRQSEGQVDQARRPATKARLQLLAI